LADKHFPKYNYVKERNPPSLLIIRIGKKQSFFQVSFVFLLTISSTFNLLFKVLFTFLSLYILRYRSPLIYLALDEIYHPIQAAFPNNPTQWKSQQDFFRFSKKDIYIYGIITLYDVLFQRTFYLINFEKSIMKTNQKTTIRTIPIRNVRFKFWALSASLAVTKGHLSLFLFLRLLKCFNSPGSLTWFEVDDKKIYLDGKKMDLLRDFL